MTPEPRYDSIALMYNELNFSQFVCGECCTITRFRNMKEVFGRLRILSKVTSVIVGNELGLLTLPF